MIKTFAICFRENLSVPMPNQDPFNTIEKEYLDFYFIGTEEQVIKRVEELNKEATVHKYFYQEQDIIDTLGS